MVEYGLRVDGFTMIDEFRDYLEQVEQYRNRNEVIAALMKQLKLPGELEALDSWKRH